jgi:hypothetical protein
MLKHTGEMNLSVKSMNKPNPLWVSVNKNGRLFSYIKKGESLFSDPFLGNFVPAGYWNATLPPLSKRLRSVVDDRAFVILSGLSIEFCVDENLKVWLPRYAALGLSNDDHFMFSAKIKLLDAFQLVPQYLIRAAHCIRKIRNEFAHKIALEHLEELDAKIIESLRRVVQEVVDDNKVVKASSVRELFDFLTSHVSMGLLAYRQNLQFLRMDIESPGYLKGLHQRLAEETDEQTQARFRLVK